MDEIIQKHGQKMYILALEYAIDMFKISGEKALPKLEKLLEIEKKELKNEE